jgi:hypothetical protein
MRRLFMSLALTGLLAGCSPAVNESVVPSTSATPSTNGLPADTADCRPQDLLLPSGEPLDLSGSWLGDDLGPYQFRQFGDCVWFVGQNATFSYVFHGRIAADFTVAGVWTTLSASDHLIGDIVNRGDTWVGTGSMVLNIEAGTGQTNADVVIRKLSDSNDPEFGPGYDINVTTWTKVDDQPDHPFPAIE